MDNAIYFSGLFALFLVIASVFAVKLSRSMLHKHLAIFGTSVMLAVVIGFAQSITGHLIGQHQTFIIGSVVGFGFLLAALSLIMMVRLLKGHEQFHEAIKASRTNS